MRAVVDIPPCLDRFGLGNVYLKTGKTTLAEYHFRKALDLNQANATLACCVGAVLEKLGRRSEALAMYDEARLAAPESSLVRFKRVRLLIKMHRHEVSISSRALSRVGVFPMLTSLGYPHRQRKRTYSRCSIRHRRSRTFCTSWASSFATSVDVQTCCGSLLKRRTLSLASPGEYLRGARLTEWRVSPCLHCRRSLIRQQIELEGSAGMEVDDVSNTTSVGQP